MVDQFHDAGFDAKHVQIKSFETGAETDAYLSRSPLALDVPPPNGTATAFAPGDELGEGPERRTGNDSISSLSGRVVAHRRDSNPGPPDS